MNYKQTDIRTILLSPEKTMTLLTMGIESSSIFHYHKYQDLSWYPEMGPAVVAVSDMPAWTFEEIRIMIGPSLTPGYVDIPFNYHPNRKGLEIRFCVNTPSALKPFNSGVEALGEALIKLIDAGVVDVEEANKRYDKIFRPI
jgi:hypothetical protein